MERFYVAREQAKLGKTGYGTTQLFSEPSAKILGGIYTLLIKSKTLHKQTVMKINQFKLK